MVRLLQNLRKALWSAFGNGALSVAKAAAYSAILSIFPALLVVTTVFATMPAGGDLRSDVKSAIQQVLPPDTMQLVQSYFIVNHARSVRIVSGSVFVSVFAAMGVLLSLMEGFRRAYKLNDSVRSFWQDRTVALALVPGTVLPLAAATIFLAFGHAIEQWMIENSGYNIRLYVLLAWRLVRWCIALIASVLSLVLVYHYGIPRPRHKGRDRFHAVWRTWRETLPGAALATASWFVATMIYGWYLTRFADYSVVYGSLGAGIATLVWLYMVSLSILIGAEFNAQLYPRPSGEKPARRGTTAASV
jgi:membrane protein